jgi:hypothetical protein
MISKFDKIYKEKYKLFFEEAPPIPDGMDSDESDDTSNNAPENIATPKGIPDGSGNEMEESETGDLITGDQKSALPDINEQQTVKIDLLNTFIDFLNMPEEERAKVLKDYGLLSSRANSENYESKLNALKSIIKNDFPNPTT